MKNILSRAFVATSLSVLVLAGPVLDAAAQSTAQSTESTARGSGFTMILSMGVGLQNDAAYEQSEVGLAGLNLGLGAFLSDNIALLFRVSGTSVKYTFEDAGFVEEFTINQTSGMAGPAIQYWANERLNLEGGIGYGFWSSDGLTEEGLGLLLGMAYVFAQTGNSNFQVGVEFAPAFTDPDAVYNVGVVFGWQLR